MVIVSVCVGSSCHLTGSEQVVEMLQKTIKEKDVEDDVVLMGSFCFGKCNRKGVTIGVDDDVFPGITPEEFPHFFEEQIMKRIEAEG